MSGKGSNPRPFSIPADEYAEKHAAIFGAPRKREPYIPPPLPGDKSKVEQIQAELRSEMAVLLKSIVSDLAPKEVDERNNSSENEVSPVRTVFGLASSLKMYRP